MTSRGIRTVGISDVARGSVPRAVIAAHHKMIEHRRTLRDSAEYRQITPDEWPDFERHFQLRRVELGDCFRPYGMPCVQEHDIRCPFLRMDPAQAPWLDAVETNTRDRLAEARSQQWLGEVAALEESLRHIRSKRAQLAAQ